MMSLNAVLRQADWLNAARITVYPRIIITVSFIVVLIMTGVSVFKNLNMPELAIDFTNVYAAGSVAQEGDAAQAYDETAHHNKEQQIEKTFSPQRAERLQKIQIPWLYPPLFLGLAWLLAFLPYLTALAIYLVGGAFAYCVALYKLAGHEKAKAALIAFPGFYVNLLGGQNGFITTALLATGLLLLDQAPVMAGLVFGLLAYKPHFFVLIPVVLAAGRHWKAAAAAIAGASICAFFSLLAFGLNAWLGFFHSLAATRVIFQGTNLNFLQGPLHSVFWMIRMYGGGLQTAYLLQIIIAFAAVFITSFVWHRRASLEVRGAALVAALLLASPYSYGYDQVILAVPITLLAREGFRTGFLPFEKIFLLGLWLLPLWFFDALGGLYLPLTPPMLTLLLYFCWQRTQLYSAAPQPALTSA